MTKILILKHDIEARDLFVLNFKHSNLDIVSDFGFRYSSFYCDSLLSESGRIAQIYQKNFKTTIRSID